MGSTFRLMTANLLHERCDADDLARVLADVDPDVLVTQELAPHCAEVVYATYPNHRLRPSIDFTGRGIATRLDAEFGEIDMPDRPGTSALLSVDGTVVRLAGVHLLNPINFPWWAAARSRRRQLDALSAWLGSGDDRPTVVAGDFNASPAWPAYKLMARTMTDLVVEWAERVNRETEATWGWRPGWPRLLRIDHVFGSRVYALDVEVRPIASTDHAAVIVDIETAGGLSRK